MRPQIVLTRPLVSQIGRNELIDVSEGALTPIRPDHAQLLVGLLKSFPSAS